MDVVSKLAETNFDRPRERLWRRGATSIGDEELLAIVLGTGVHRHTAIDVARELVRASGGMIALSRASPREVSQVLGIGSVRAARVVAAFELGRRAIESENHRDTLCHAEDVYRLIGPRLSGLVQEVFVVIGVDVRNGKLDVVEVARGSVATVEVHPREVFRPLIRMAAAGGIVVHNHPTGDPTPSHEDVELTRRLRDAGAVIGIPIIDHVIVGNNGFRSVAEWVGAAS